MKIRTLGIPICLVLFASACGTAGGAGALTREAINATDRTRDESRTYHYVDSTLDGKSRVEVDGRIQDDLRYSGTVTLNGKKLYEEVVTDDSVALRLLDPEATKPVVEAARRLDPTTADALAAGRWVIDHTVAPPLLAAAADPGDESEQTADKPGLGQGNLVGDDPFTDSAQLLNYADRALRTGLNVERFDPEDIDYNVLDDPWAKDGEVDLEGKGIRRYDLRQPPLPPPAERGKRQSLPTIQHFRKLVVYVEGERVTKIREQISIKDRREFRRAEQGRTAKFYLEMRDAALVGGIRDELRERLMEYAVTKVGGVTVKAPLDAENGFLTQVLPALKALFEFDFIGGNAARVAGGAGAGRIVPTVPGSSAAGSPGATTGPAATVAPAPSPKP